GGIAPRETTSLIVSQFAFASAYVVSGNGPFSPSRWHDSQLRWTIRATRFVHVGGVFGVGVASGFPPRRQPGAQTASSLTGKPRSAASSAARRYSRRGFSSA